MTEHSQFLARHVHQLSEHFDTVQILATRLLPNGDTRMYDCGSGNTLARVEHARSYVRCNNARDIRSDTGLTTGDEEVWL